jgi:hypothetical protein
MKRLKQFRGVKKVMIFDEPFATPGRASWLELPGNRRLFLNTPRLNWNLALPTSKVGQLRRALTRSV